MFRIFNSLAKFKKRTALVSENNSISYQDLIKKSDKIKKTIKGKTVCLMIAQNNQNFIISYVAFLRKKKVITILIDETFGQEFIQNLLKIYKPNYVLSPSKYFNLFSKENSIFNLGDYSIFETSSKIHNKLNFKNYLLLSTSGTTQSPKFVRLSSLNLENNVKKIQKYLNIKSNQTTITTMPIGYSYGLSILNTHLSAGAKIFINNRSIFEKEFWNNIKKQKINSFGGVPEFYDYLKKIDFKKRVSKSIKYLTQAGGKLSTDSLKYFGKVCEKNKIKFYIMYGQTEASPRMTYLDWKSFFKKIGSVGKPLKGYKVALQDIRGKKITTPEKKGEIVFSGKNVCLGYATSFLDLQKGDENKGILKTGDLGKFDKSNHLFVLQRKDKYIKFFGKRCNLTDVEKFLKKNSCKCKCYYENPNIVVSLKHNYNSKKIKKLLSNFLRVNSNFITVKKNSFKSYKEYKNEK